MSTKTSSASEIYAQFQSTLAEIDAKHTERIEATPEPETVAEAFLSAMLHGGHDPYVAFDAKRCDVDVACSGADWGTKLFDHGCVHDTRHELIEAGYAKPVESDEDEDDDSEPEMEIDGDSEGLEAAVLDLVKGWWGDVYAKMEGAIDELRQTEIEEAHSEFEDAMAEADVTIHCVADDGSEAEITVTHEHVSEAVDAITEATEEQCAAWVGAATRAEASLEDVVREAVLSVWDQIPEEAPAGLSVADMALIKLDEKLSA